MASKNIEDWNQPLPSNPVSSEEGEEEEEEINTYEECMRQEKIKMLQKYVDKMAYKPTKPLPVKPYFENLAKPKKNFLLATTYEFADVITPKDKKKRLNSLSDKYTTITAEQLEQIIHNTKTRERRQEDVQKRKQELYYDMLTKLEKQCRTQYLNVLIKKFATFISKLATTMHIPPTLVEPYGRMHRGIFCNILLAIGLQPTSQAAIYYNTAQAGEYEVCHKLAHALLSLIIKALDSASTRDPNDIECLEAEFEMDNYIKERLMLAANKKIQNITKCTHKKKKMKNKDESAIAATAVINRCLKKCSRFT